MQLGMVGLGRMGANMVRRFIKGGHQCVVFDMSPKVVEELVREKAMGPSRSRTRPCQGSQAESQTRERGGGQSRPPLTRPFRHQFSPQRFTSASAHAARRISRTSSCRPCVFSLAATGKSPGNEEEIINVSHSAFLLVNA
jgi:hypothetical protein